MNMEPCRRALRDLGSLQTSAWVDVFIDNVIIQSQMTDPYEIKKHVIRLMHAKYKMLDSCTIMDRVKALEIIEDAKKEHRRHLNYTYGCARMVAGDGGKAVKLEPTEYNETEMLVESDPVSFKESVRAIPSLQNPTAIQALDQLCDLYSIAAKSKSNEERENLLFHMMELKTLLHDMCANQTEKTNFILAIEVSREKPQNKRITGKFLEDLQYGLD
ncbi:hypothetical protein BCR33DRAFT_335066 [Rhizoclosmatium globosum]|uniref:Uncharacterized protein n=1 Tax=Rhizoclosmatium globosum TaxID=329046 RepID=A0A1Y2C3D5_9FUNG|nr:hypothetical protein BCR33DRAFT_335066 [Rhizoclosmatium globosum]|eukprot:ORY41550.1 hypothetical protein BCR33DRAFT_335066 [Rhizoclosmatium globosum]